MWAAFVKSGSPVTADNAGRQAIGADGVERGFTFAPEKIEAYDPQARHRCAFGAELDPVKLGALR